MTLQIIRKIFTRLAFWLTAFAILSVLIVNDTPAQAGTTNVAAPATQTQGAAPMTQPGQQDAFPAVPQSPDSNNPTRLATRSFRGQLTGTGQGYFYSFTAGPGQVNLTLVVASDGNSAQAVVDLFGQNGSPLLSNFAVRGNANGEPVSQMVTVAARQNVILRVRDTNGSKGAFGVQLDGAVEVGSGDTGPGTVIPGSSYQDQTGLGTGIPGYGYQDQDPTVGQSDGRKTFHMHIQTKKHGTFTITFSIPDRRQRQYAGPNGR